MKFETFKAIVEKAKYAPSAHNTQPVRWTLNDDGTILISADLSRRLPVGDPDDRDLMIACGTAVEGTVLALAQIGLGAHVKVLSAANTAGRRPVAVIQPDGRPHKDDLVLAEYVLHRMTHRLGFAPSPQSPDLASLKPPGVTIVQKPSQIAWLSRKIDHASARIMLDGRFRTELLDWMRLSPRDVRYHQDGLNREALGMDRLTAFATRPILGSAVYRFLSALGLGPILSGEAKKSQTSTAVLLFHAPKDGSMVEAGRSFYRTWLEVTALGFAGWPAAALADHTQTALQISERFGLANDQILFNALRVGSAKGETPKNARLATDDLIDFPAVDTNRSAE